jgi:hypothetical protein
VAAVVVFVLEHQTAAHNPYREVKMGFGLIWLIFASVAFAQAAHAAVLVLTIAPFRIAMPLMVFAIVAFVAPLEWLSIRIAVDYAE